MKFFLAGKNPRQDLEINSDTSFLGTMLRRGHELAVSLDSDVDALICVDYVASEKSILLDARGLKIPVILVKQEPIVVFPVHRFANPGNLFDWVITKGQFDGVEMHNYGNVWPKSISFNTDARLPKFVAITANKWSAVDGQLYDLRREVYSSDSRVDLFGRGWDKSRFNTGLTALKEIIVAASSGVFPAFPDVRLMNLRPKNYCGEISEKFEVMNKYDFSLVIENCGFYTSEKLMDSLLAGNLVVYVGANIAPQNIPNNFVIQADPNLKSVSDAMDLLAKRDAKTIRLELLDWLKQDSTEKKWSANHVNATILRRIEDYVLINRK
jgi:hypothetical protein